MRTQLNIPIQSSSLSIYFSLLIICFSIQINAQSYIFWADNTNDSINRANLNGTSRLPILSSLNEPKDIAVDQINGHIYYLDKGNMKIVRTNLDGSSSVDIVTTGITNPACIVLDISDGKMYWTDSSTETIKRAGLDGSNVETLVSESNVDIQGIDLDLISNKIYWTEGNTNYIRRSNLDGSNQESLITNGLDDPYGIALDVENNYIYWVENDGDVLSRAELDGTNPTDLLVLLATGSARDMDIDHINGKLYWIDSAKNRIYRCNLDGTGSEYIIENCDGYGIDLYNTGPHTTFSGTGNWSSSERWNNGVPNSASKDVIIDGDCTFDGDYAVKDMGVKSGGSVTLNSSTELTISGGLTNCAGASGFKLESDASNTASLILSESCEESIEVERNMKGASTGWHLVGVPVGGQSIDELVKASSNSISVNGSQYGLGVYNESEDSWTTYTTSTAPSAGNLQAGKGYEIIRSSDGDVSFSGTPATDQVDVSVTKSGNGWNLIGNPYSCALYANSNADATKNFITQNSSALDDSFEAIYIWNPSTDQYEIVNQSSDASYIPSGQGFFIKAAEAGTLSFKPDMRTHQTATSFKSGSSIPKIILNANNGEKVRTTEFRFLDGVTIGLDPGFDAGMFNTDESDFALSSRLSNDNGIRYALQCLPLEVENNITVPLELYSVSNEIEFVVESFNLPEGINTYLEDKQEDKIIDIKSCQTYKADVDISSIKDRFFLHFSLLNLGCDEVEKNVNEYVLLPNSKNSTIFIKGDINKIQSLKIFDVSGRLVFESENITDHEIKIPKNANGMLLVNIRGDQINFSQKINWIN